MLCCPAWRSQPTIFISASFVPSLLVGYRKVYSVRCEADVVMTSVIKSARSCLRSVKGNEHALASRHARERSGQPPQAERVRAFYGASRSASDATSLVYTTSSVLRGRRTPPFGSVGSCVASYRLFLDSILVKVFASVTKNRDVSLLC